MKTLHFYKVKVWKYVVILIRIDCSLMCHVWSGIFLDTWVSISFNIKIENPYRWIQLYKVSLYESNPWTSLLNNEYVMYRKNLVLTSLHIISSWNEHENVNDDWRQIGYWQYNVILSPFIRWTKDYPCWARTFFDSELIISRHQG